MKKTAEERGIEMFTSIKFGELPLLAQEFAKKLCREVGGCGEVFITAFAVYAQCVEGLLCTDDLYKASNEHIGWFKDRIEEESKDEKDT